jgi:flagella basal body P-ring formation protein FlgA
LAVTIELEVFGEILTAARDLPFNSKMSATEVVSARRRIGLPLAAYLRDAEKLRGLVTVKAVAKGAELTLDAVASGIVVKYGDIVRLEARSGSLKITVAGEARAAGKIGDRIAVKNTQSGAILQGVVVDEGLVKVNF